MPKVKKIRAAALSVQQTRHAPLGQVLQDDEDRGKYAAVGRYRLKPNKGRDEENDSLLLDEKTSKRILDLSREQQLEIDREDERQRRRKGGLQEAADSSDEEEYEEGPSVLLDDDEAE